MAKTNFLEKSESYSIKLSNFKGPLDALLDMVKVAKIDIEDIFLSQITDQYLAHMKQIDDLDLDQAADFIVVAATLIEIKAKSLLPQPEDEEVAAEGESTKKAFIQKLQEYKLFKDASRKLQEYEQVGMRFREPDPTVGDYKMVLKDMTEDKLVDALMKFFIKAETRAQHVKQKKIVLEPFTIEQKQKYIEMRVYSDERVMFDDLFDENMTKNELITTFQALLELMKNQRVRVVQNDVFSPIEILKAVDNGD